MTAPTAQGLASAGIAAASTAPPGAAVGRLYAYDGLFLRAQHLDRMQEYTRERTAALGQAGGPGVVHGYGLQILVEKGSSTLEVSAGMAFNAAGRPLIMTSPQTKELDGIPGSDGEWLITIVPFDESYGSEEVYGALCDDPCGENGATTRPFIAERVKVELEKLSGLADSSSGVWRRSHVASVWFEKERTRLNALLPTSDNDKDNLGKQSLADFASSSWDQPTGLSSDEAVPIGMLLRIGSDWYVDAWITRRDRIDTPPRRAWQQRLGMRPMDVFLAQVLQFQVQLAEHWPQAAAVISGLLERQQAMTYLHAVSASQYRKPTVVRDNVEKAIQLLERQLSVSPSPNGLLYDRGFEELPPAGYLPLAGGQPVHQEVDRMFGQPVELRYCTCRPDYVAHAVEQAQHLDRIRLGPNAPKSQVDILVPGGTWGYSGEISTPHNWIVFHRRRRRDCDYKVDKAEVDLYLYNTDQESYANVIQAILQGELPTADKHAIGIFPADTTRYREPELPPAVKGWTDDAEVATVIALVRLPGMAPAAGMHGSMLASVFEEDPSVVDSLRTEITRRDLPTETIHVVVRIPHPELAAPLEAPTDTPT